jgi:DNA-binding response OmpR family regulator/nitrogen-specific signal transduction histidine kinase
MAGGQTVRGRHKDGGEFPVEVSLSPVPDREGVLVLGSVLDLSERVRLDRLKDDFVSTVSHELRTPLTSIAGSLALMVGGVAGPLPDPMLRLLTIAHKNSERLVRLINDILDIEKIESGKVVFDIRRLDAQAFVEQAIEANRAFADSFGVSVRLEPVLVPCDVLADADRLVQVVTNLLSNAAKFSPVGTEVVVAVTVEDQMVRISVRDHGPGIPNEFRPRIFQKFAQADAGDARQKGGTGLGLSIVQQIVIRMGGDVWFDDAPGGGTTFFVTVPRWKSVARHGPAIESADGPRVLLCESDPCAAHAVAERVAAAGFSIEIAASAETAIGRAVECDYAAILVDLQLPDSDGISLIQGLRALSRHHNTPIVVVSADPMSGRNDLRSCNLNVLDWLEKPIDIENLMRVLDRPIVRTRNRPRILHVDDDATVLGVVAQALDATADVVSVDSLEAARRALRSRHFDLAVLDVALAANSGLDLLPDLYDGNGDPIPVIVFSAQGANRACAAQVREVLTKSRASIDHLIAILSKGQPRELPVDRGKEVA